ncbi:MAG TPA: aminotransferase class V-fold PLP-dependent enzyme [Gaiellaceae bacterium]|nr:aminotransferase class V-fold PLP-dependent enzyme [Gaiellaceae bacterium]
MQPLESYRDRFPILEHTTYLINHSLGAMPVGAEEGLRRYAWEWRERGVRAWEEGWWETSVTTGDRLGRIVGAPPGSIAMHQNVAVAEAVVLSCFEFEPPRNRIVFGEGEFPSVRYLQQAQRRHGAEVEIVENDEAVVAAIDERTLLVPISHVLSMTSEIQNVEAIVRRAHEVGALVVLDAYHSAGTIPLDLTALDVDFAVGGSVKWLCGGPGAGWLYVRPDLAERLEPTFTGWQAHARPFAFEPELEYAEGAWRFLTGTPNVPALYAASAGYDLIAEVGVERIREHSLRQTGLLAELVEASGFAIASPRAPERRGGAVVVRTPEAEAVQRELDAREIVCDVRPGVGIRFGPHFFSTDDEVRYAAAQLAEIVVSGAYEPRLDAAPS